MSCVGENSTVVDIKMILDEEESCDAKDERPLPITLLEGNGNTTEDIRKLQEKGFKTVESVAFAPKHELWNIKGFSEVKATKMIFDAGRLAPMTFLTAPSTPYRISEILTMTTGSKKIDDILGGGVKTSYITEVFGEFGVGKTQLCHTLAVSCQRPVDEGGAAGRCLYIDTENAFRPERIIQIADRFRLNATDVMNNITFAKANTLKEQNELLQHSLEILRDARYALMIVDSSTFQFRLAYPGSEKIFTRQMHLSRFLRNLLMITDTFGIAVVITNQVYTNFDRNAPDPIVPVGGKIMAHASRARLYLRRGNEGTRYGKRYDSPCVPKPETTFAIAKGGIVDL